MNSLFKKLSAIANSTRNQSLVFTTNSILCKRLSLKRANKLGKLINLIVAGALLAPQVIVMSSPVRADQVGICATPGKDGTATISGIVNSYYPGTGTVAVGSTSVSVGAINPNGNTTPIAQGDLLLIIQMQDADINSTDTDAYGNGVGGDVNSNTNIVPSPLAASGYTNLNNAGRYEYAVAAGPISGGVIPLTKGTTYSYRASAAAGSAGRRSFQVVRVPQYTSATITGTLTTAAQWNGSSGGIVAVDVQGALNFGAGSAVDVNSLGFRGGGSNPNGFSGASKSTFRTTSQGSLAGVDGPKGEGIAGTPRFVARQPFGSFNVRATTITDDLGTSGYPNGDEGRGAPANAGGGGNEHNSGGGGGANGGAGGLGGRSYGDSRWGNTAQPQFDAAVGGFGGTPIPTDPIRLVLGGGGGGGDTNDQSRPSGAGGGGGGMVLIRAGSISGSGTINAKGADGIDSPAGALPDAGGGGGAGGTVLVTTQTGNASGLTIVATGGIGGDLNENNTTETDGPGGGGGGGTVYTTGGATVNVSGGAPGLIVNGQVRNNTPNSATPGTTGINQTITASSLTTSISGSNPGCLTYSISGTLYKDENNNNSNDSEPALGENVTVTLYKDNDNDNVIDAGEQVGIPVFTNTNGQYSFSNVLAGTYKIKVDTTDTDIPIGFTLGTPNDLTAVVTNANVTGQDFGFDPSNPNILLIKRITAVNGLTTTKDGDNLAVYKDENTNPYDDNNITVTNPNPPTTPADTDKWPDPNTFLIGGTNGGNVRPGDELEYTIYYLSAGDATAKNVLMCDRIPNNVTFIPTGFNNFPTKAPGTGSDRGILWQYNGEVESLTNYDSSGKMRYLPPGVEPKTIYFDANNPNKKVVDCGGENTNGAIIVNLGDLPNATAPATPTASYGFVRFRGRVK
ncbi:hypothetical protein NIES4101_85940 [Calothrix sp. NIES-4101]|nr:hypothetical protein NIES4101_85940 [Calothrix sp. NIES-4101]